MDARSHLAILRDKERIRGVKCKRLQNFFPVFFVLLMGLYARKRNWISHEQNDGIKSLALGILFPFLIYNIVADASLDKQIGVEIVYLIGVWIFVYFLGRLFCRIMPKELSELSPFLLLTCEGGAVALPLYISVVGSAYAVNLIPFDLAGILVNFIFVPTVLQLKQSNKFQLLPLIKKCGVGALCNSSCSRLCHKYNRSSGHAFEK